VNASHSSRPTTGEWIQTILLGGNLAWTTLCLGGYRPETMQVTSALSGATLAVHFARCGVCRCSWRQVHPAGWALVAFLLYAGLNVIVFSPARWLGWSDWIGWANLIATFGITLHGVRSSMARKVLLNVLVVLGVVGVAMACYQRFSQPDWLMLGRQQAAQFIGRSSGPFGIPNSFAGFLLLLLPAAGALAFRARAAAAARVWWGWVTLVLSVGLFLTLSRGAWIGLALALMSWPLLRATWAWRRRLGIAVAVLVAVMGVAFVLHQTVPVARERLDRLARDSGELSRPILWRAAWNLFLERPVVGTGAGSYGLQFEKYRPAGFIDAPQWTHNDYLNTASDYGVVGFALFFGASLGLAIRFRNRIDVHREDVAAGWMGSRTLRTAMGVGVLAFALQLFVEFHLKIPALAMAVAVTAALALGRERVALDAKPSDLARAGRWVWFALAGACAVSTYPLTRFYAAEALRYHAREIIDRSIDSSPGSSPETLAAAETQLRAAVQRSPGNGSAWSDLAFALQFRAFVTPEKGAAFGPLSEEAARRALALSEVVPEFWIRLGIALDMQGRRGEADTAFVRCLQLAPQNGAGWYYYAAHLALDTNQREAALRAVAKCLSLDPGNRAAEALRARLNPRL
jgi:O-antigen ligase